MDTVQISPEFLLNSGFETVSQCDIIMENLAKLGDSLKNDDNLSKKAEQLKKYSETMKNFGQLLIKIGNEWQLDKNRQNENNEGAEL